MIDTIKINREMLKEAFQHVQIKFIGATSALHACLENELFGPKKPREVWVSFYPNGKPCSVSDSKHGGPFDEVTLFREAYEVLGDYK